MTALKLTPWIHLAQKPGSVYRQLFINGRNISARTLYGQHVSDGESRTAEQIAADYDLPLDAVREALAYCESDPPEVRQDWEREEAASRARDADDFSSPGPDKSTRTA